MSYLKLTEKERKMEEKETRTVNYSKPLEVDVSNKGENWVDVVATYPSGKNLLVVWQDYKSEHHAISLHKNSARIRNKPDFYWKGAYLTKTHIGLTNSFSSKEKARNVLPSSVVFLGWTKVNMNTGEQEEWEAYDDV